METRAQSPPTPALHARQGEGGQEKGRRDCEEEERGARVRTPRASAGVPPGRGGGDPGPAPAALRSKGASLLTPDSRRACHTCTPLDQRPGHTRGHTHSTWDLPPPTSTPTMLGASDTHSCCRDPGICGTRHVCTHTKFLLACEYVYTHTLGELALPPTTRSWNQISYQVPEARNVPCSAAPPPGHLALLGGSRSPSQD